MIDDVRTPTGQRILVSLFGCVLWLCVSPAASAQRVEGLPPGLVAERMLRAWHAWNELHAGDVIIEEISADGIVKDVGNTSDQMLKTMAIPGDAADASHVRIYDLGEVAGTATPARIEALRQALQSHLAVGDLRIVVKLRNRKSGISFASLNSMRPDGSDFSGTFLATARIASRAGGSRTHDGGLPALDRAAVVPVALIPQWREPACVERVITRYLWGAPAESVRGCVRADCNGGRVQGCLATDVDAFAGFFAEVKIVPQAGTRGHIGKNCCRVYFNYVWATGFKSIKIAAKGVSLEVEGHIGQSANGGFAVEDCCGR